MALMLSIALLVSASVEPGDDRAQCLPGSQSELRSPSGNAALRLGQYDEVREEHQLELVLEGAAPMKLYTFGRSVCIAWAPNGSAFGITDNLGSNIGQTYVVYLEHPKEFVNMTPLLPRCAQAFLRDNSHGYVQVKEWVETGLHLRVLGDFLEPPEMFEMEVNCTGNPKITSCQPLALKLRFN